jgi:hypothetical protein
MFNPSITQSLVQTRVEDIHRAARSNGRSRRLSRPPSPADALAGRFNRAIARVFDAGRRPAADDAVAIPSFELVGDSSSATWSPGA